MGHDWLGELTNLKNLLYGKTYFEYEGIPDVIGKLTNLEEYDCSYTLYNGPLKGEIFSNTLNLNWLSIGGNNFNSSIPYELASLPRLEFMYAEYAGIIGDLSFLPHMPSIVELWIDRNYKMRGSIPPEIGNISTLQSLSITDTGLIGTLPSELGLLPLKQFWGNSNGRLRGQIPSELGQLEDLVHISLVKTSLSGTVPDEICANTISSSGILRILETDCQEDVGTVDCPCCSCCGNECIIP